MPNRDISHFLEHHVMSGGHYKYQHDDVTKWKHFPRYRPFVRGIHRWPGNSPHKGQCRGALIFSLIWAWINGWVNYGEAGDLRRHRANYDVTVMSLYIITHASVCFNDLRLCVQYLWNTLVRFNCTHIKGKEIPTVNEITYPFSNFNGATVEV